MSRGPGRTQRAVLDAVQAAADGDGLPRWVSVDEVVAGSPHHSVRESVRRAMRTLAAAGRVEIGYVRGRTSGGDRWMVAVRRPASEE